MSSQGESKQIVDKLTYASNLQKFIDKNPRTYRYLRSKLQQQFDQELESKRETVAEDPDCAYDQLEIIQKQIDQYDNVKCDKVMNDMTRLIIQNIPDWVQSYSHHKEFWQRFLVADIGPNIETKTPKFVPQFNCQYLLLSIYDYFFTPAVKWSLFAAITDADIEILGENDGWFERKINEISNPDRAHSQSSDEGVERFVEELSDLLIAENLAPSEFVWGQSRKSAAKV